MAISGGVDSTVAATLINKAIGKQLICVFIDNGLLRYNEYEDVLRIYKKIEFNIIFNNPDNELTNLMKHQYYSPYFEPIFNSSIENYSSSSSRENLSINCSGLPFSTKNPVIPSTIISGFPPTLVATTGFFIN